MKCLAEYYENIHSCSKCGLCQSVCPIYKITGNDCTVSRGQFIMLRGLIKGDLKMSKVLNRYLDICLKCGACSKFCPAGIDVVDIVAAAKAEYFKTSLWCKFTSYLLRNFVFGIGLNIVKFFRQIFSRKKTTAPKKYAKKVIYFGGCGNKLFGHETIQTILNALEIELITPDFNCCGLPFYVNGDFDSFEYYMKDFFKKLDAVKQKENLENIEIVTNCASCEKMIKSYAKWSESADYEVKNVLEYIRENNLSLELKNPQKVTFHKPCNMSNFADVEWILNNTKNLEYVEMQDYDKCCGLNGVSKISEYKIMMKLFMEKHHNIVEIGVKTVLTSCLGCESVLKLFSFGKYKVQDLAGFLSRNIKND